MEALPVILAIASIAGAIGSAHGKKFISQDFLDNLLGAKGYGEQFNQFLQTLQSSPQGQALFTAADNMSNQVASQMRSNAVNAGWGGAEGAHSGGEVFSSAVAPQVAAANRMKVNSYLGTLASEMTKDSIKNRLSALLGDNGRMTPQGATWAAIGNAAGTAINAGWGIPDTPTSTNNYYYDFPAGGNPNGTVSGPGGAPLLKPKNKAQVASNTPAQRPTSEIAMASYTPERQQNMFNFKQARYAQPTSGFSRGRLGVVQAPSGGYS